MDPVGNAKLREGAAAAGDGHGPRRIAGAFPRGQSRKRVSRILMLNIEQAGEIFDRIRKLSEADETEVLFTGGRFALTRFANNTIHQNVAEENHVVSVRSVFGKKTARAFTNKFDEESLHQVVQSSKSLARVQKPDPDLLQVPTGDEASRRSE